MYSLPIFPNFKRIDLLDKNIIQKYTSNFEPYSDFNFVSMYVWNGDNAEYSFLNENLVIRMDDYDYIGGTKVFSILGTKDINSSLKEIASLTKQIKFVPEATLVNDQEINKKFKRIEDIDNFDYIYQIKELLKLEGSHFFSKRRSIRKFQKEFSTYKVTKLDFTDVQIQENIRSLLNIWHANKNLSEDHIKSSEERFERLFQTASATEFENIGIHIGNELKGFTVNEKINTKYSIGHFLVSDKNYLGIADTLFFETAKTISSDYINTQQDGGIEGLRLFKHSWHPIKMLKKFTVELE